MLLFIIRTTMLYFCKHLKATTSRKHIDMYLSNQYVKRRKIGNERKQKASLMVKQVHFPDNPELIKNYNKNADSLNGGKNPNAMIYS